MSGWPRFLAALAVGVFAAATLVELARRLTQVCGLDHSLGVYLSLAELARQGVVYPREQSAELVYCTLYQPLGFLPYALLPGSGLGLIPAMRALVRLEVVLAIAGAVLLLRRCGAGTAAAPAAVLLLLCATPVAAAMLTCTDDPRGALLAMLAFAAFAPRGGVLHPWRAAPLFALAFFTKLTAPGAAGVAALAVAWQRRQPRVAGLLVLGSVAWTLAGYAAAHAVLGWDLAGNGLRYALLDPKPGRDLALQAGHFAAGFGCEPATALLLGGGLLGVLLRARRRRADALDVWFAAALLRAFVEYRSHGTELNHLFEPCLLGAVAAVRSVSPRLRPALVLAGLPVLFWLGRPVRRLPCDPSPLAAAPIAAVADVLRAQAPAPTLCEDPLLAWIADQRPLVTDPFLAGQVLRREPAIRAAWFGAASDPRALQRLVLLVDPERADGRAERWYGDLHFDAVFLADVRRLFRVVAPSDFGVALQRR